MKKKILSIVSVLLIATILVGCGPTETPTQPTEVETIEEPTQPVEITTEETPTEAVEVTEPITATFWTAPNPTQTVFWQSMAEAYMAAQANIKIDVSAMAETPTSEGHDPNLHSRRNCTCSVRKCVYWFWPTTRQ